MVRLEPECQTVSLAPAPPGAPFRPLELVDVVFEVVLAVALVAWASCCEGCCAVASATPIVRGPAALVRLPAASSTQTRRVWGPSLNDRVSTGMCASVTCSLHGTRCWNS